MARKEQAGRNGPRFRDILAAATEEFAARGYRGTNLANVAERLDVTRQALYYYFPRKHDMLKAIIFAYFDELEKAVAEAEKSATTASDRFVKMLGAHIALVASQPVATAVFMQESGNMPRADQEQIMKRRVLHQRKFTDAYSAAVEAGDFEALPVGLVVSTILGAGNWSYRWFKPHGGKLTVDEFAEFASSLLRHGFERKLPASTNGADQRKSVEAGVAVS